MPHAVTDERLASLIDLVTEVDRFLHGRARASADEPLSVARRAMYLEEITEGIAERGGSFYCYRLSWVVRDGKLVGMLPVD